MRQVADRRWWSSSRRPRPQALPPRSAIALFPVRLDGTTTEVEDELVSAGSRRIVVLPADFAAGSAAARRRRSRSSSTAAIPTPRLGAELRRRASGQLAAAGGRSPRAARPAGRTRDRGRATRSGSTREIDSRNFLVPGSIAIVMTLIGTLLTALVVAREWERGTMEALMATPVRRGRASCSASWCPTSCSA